jgi:hypothetical protein
MTSRNVDHLGPLRPGCHCPSRVELLDARLMTLPTKVIDGVLHYVNGRDGTAAPDAPGRCQVVGRSG